MSARCRTGRWWWGLPVVAVLAAAAGRLTVPRIEADLARRLSDAERARSGMTARYEVEGRDAVASDPGGRLAAIDLGQVSGLRRILPRGGEVVVPTAPVLTLRREGQRIVLGGAIAPASRQAIEAALRAQGFGGEIADETSGGDAAPPPPRMAALLQVARDLARLRTGEARLEGDALSLSGEAAEFETYNAVRDGWRAPPAGITVASLNLVPPVASPFGWSANRRDDALDLAGYVPSEEDRDALLAQARARLPGVPVGDRMQTARGAPPALLFRDASAFALGLLARVDRGRADLAGAVLSLDGKGQDRDGLAAIAEAMRAALPAGLAAGTLTLAALPVSPYSFAARRGQGFLTLTGFVPNEAARARILDVGRKSFLTEQIVDRLHVGDGAPPAFIAGVAFALEQLGQIASGEARLQDTVLSISGEALYRQSGERVRARILSPPPGWTSRADIAIATRERVLDPDLCQDLLSEAAAHEPVSFEPRAVALTAEAGPRLAGVAAILRRCGVAPVTVGIESPDGADAALASGRIAVLIAALIQAGIEPSRLRPATNQAAARPVADGKPAASLASFRVAAEGQP